MGSIYGNNVLITFEMLVDTEIGLLDLIKDLYNDESVFNNNILDLDINHLKGLLQSMSDKNPLNLILLNYDKEQADSFYNEFIEKEYENILVRSPITTLVDMIKKFIDAESKIKVNILCKNKLEYNHINIIMSDCLESCYKIITENSRENINLETYDTIFIKYMDELLEFKGLEGKNIIVCDYLFNLDKKAYEEYKQIPRLDICAAYADINEFYITNLYPYDNSYYFNEEDSKAEG